MREGGVMMIGVVARGKSCRAPHVALCQSLLSLLLNNNNSKQQALSPLERLGVGAQAERVPACVFASE